jgi:flagellar hook-basal body complex protein FliE
MTKRSLSEAAAEVLKSSVAGAPAQPRQSLEGDQSGLGTGENLGGDFPDRVASENPDATKPVGKAKEPGPAPRVGSDPKKKLRSNNGHMGAIDLQKQGPNSFDDGLTHVKLQSNEEVQFVDEDGNAIDADDLFEDADGNLYDSEGNQIVIEAVDEDGNVIDFDDTDNDNTLEEGEEVDGEETLVDGNTEGEYEDQEDLTEEENVVLFDREAIYESFQAELDADLGALLDSDSTLSEDFKSKVRTIFEAAVMARVDQMADTLEASFVETLGEAVEEIKQGLTEQTNEYLSYVAEQWMSDNEIAIEKSLRTELTEDFINGLKALFVEHYIEIPEDKVDVIEELSEEVAQVENRLNEEISRNVELTGMVKAYQAQEVFTAACDGLTDVQVDKLASLAEGIEFTTAEEFSKKLDMLRENYFTGSESTLTENKEEKSASDTLNETIEIVDDKQTAQPQVDPEVAKFVNSLNAVKQK